MTTLELLQLLGQGLLETLYMTLISTFLSYLIGLPLGMILTVTDKKGLRPNRAINLALGFVINMLRSVPFLILAVAIIPFTRWIVGTSIGSTATIVPLVVAAAPYVARMIESSLREVDAGVIEAARSMGSSDRQVLFKVMVPEAKPSLLVGATIATTTILGYSAMAGFMAGGGLGTIAINYGYHRYNTEIMLYTVALLIIVVQVMQEAGLHLTRRLDRRRRAE
ncbi:MAG: ABC transporter permease [Clostridiaceae bacterium]|nr:ABC transporter permease [Clostridiaceae bacterium]